MRTFAGAVHNGAFAAGCRQGLQRTTHEPEKHYYEHQDNYRDIDYREYAKEIVKYDVDIEEQIDFDALDYFDVKERPYKAENSYLHNNLYSNPNNRKDIKLVDNDTIMYNTIGFRTLIYKKEK